MAGVEKPIIAYIALGANLGDRSATIGRAVEMLNATPGVRVRKTSALVENPAVGGPPGSPMFLNGAAEIETSLSARDLLARLLEIEQTLGRQRLRKWDPRTIDLDLLLYGDRVIQEPELTVPHPRMHERAFVLDPLAQIAPDAIHPRLGKTIRQLRGELQ